MTNRQNPIYALQENASQFFDKVSKKYPDEMKCKAGCSKCCMTDISIFAIEALIVEDWFLNKNDTQKNELKSIWSQKTEKGACAFLYENQCTIYEARPVICRTQGLPIHLAEENILDYCPLNFETADPPKEDWLNLNRLNTLLSFAAKTSQLDERVRLKKLKDKLLAN